MNITHTDWLEAEKMVGEYMATGLSEKERQELEREIPLDRINMMCEGIRYMQNK